MTFEELDERFPNGFDDAEISAINIDYEKRTAKLELRLRASLPDSPDRDVYSRGALVVSGIYYISIDAADAGHVFGSPAERITVNGYPEDRDQFPLFGFLHPKLSPGAFCCRFFVHDWNSFIHIAARQAAFSLGTAISEKS